MLKAAVKVARKDLQDSNEHLQEASNEANRQTVDNGKLKKEVCRHLLVCYYVRQRYCFSSAPFVGR